MLGQQQIIKALFKFHMVDRKELQLLLPEDRWEELAHHQDTRRAVADHIASLTERDASALYARLTGVQIGAITDAL
jgi:dGTP triphosphohydrolase